MPVQDELRRIADRAHRELDSVHDFFEHSKIVWRSFQTFVEDRKSTRLNSSHT